LANQRNPRGSTQSVLGLDADDFSTVPTRGFAKFEPAAAVSAVPEPATWAMMIGGFGMVGGSLRSRRRQTKVAFATA
jgi:hypothetical protein